MIDHFRVTVGAILSVLSLHSCEPKEKAVSELEFPLEPRRLQSPENLKRYFMQSLRKETEFAERLGLEHQGYVKCLDDPLVEMQVRHFHNRDGESFYVRMTELHLDYFEFLFPARLRVEAFRETGPENVKAAELDETVKRLSEERGRPIEVVFVRAGETGVEPGGVIGESIMDAEFLAPGVSYLSLSKYCIEKLRGKVHLDYFAKNAVDYLEMAKGEGNPEHPRVTVQLIEALEKIVARDSRRAEGFDQATEEEILRVIAALRTEK